MSHYVPPHKRRQNAGGTRAAAAPMPPVYVPPHKRRQKAGGTRDAADQTCRPCAGGSNDGAAAAQIEMQPDIGQPAAPRLCYASRRWDPNNRNKRCGEVTFREVTFPKGPYRGMCFSCALFLAREAGNTRQFQTEAVNRMGEMGLDELAQVVADNRKAIAQCKRERPLHEVYTAATGECP